MRLIVATGNAHKVSEIKQILDLSTLEVVSAKEVLGQVPDVEENGLTYFENAALKVLAFPDRGEDLILADDSGIEVQALDNRPGLYSARYAGDHASSELMCAKLLGELGSQPNRTARFVCVLALRFPSLSDKDKMKLKALGAILGESLNPLWQNLVFAEGIAEGVIAFQASGEQGHGYDPVFQPMGYTQTYGDMSVQHKNKISHRFKALDLLRKLLD